MLVEDHRARPVESLPVRERGLKLMQSLTLSPSLSVAPRAGAWIETPAMRSNPSA